MAGTCLRLCHRDCQLYWVFRQFDYKQMETDVRTLQWGWVALGIVLNVLVFVVDGWRWSVLLSPFEDAPPIECIKAVFIGIVANGVLPAKAGEVIRCYLLSTGRTRRFRSR